MEIGGEESNKRKKDNKKSKSKSFLMKHGIISLALYFHLQKFILEK